MASALCGRAGPRFCEFTAAGITAVGTVATSLLGAPTALAAPPPQDDLWSMLNDAHVQAGCAPYEHAGPLGDVAVQYARTMSEHDGQKNFSSGPAFSPTTDQLLDEKGYYHNLSGEMEFYTHQPAPLRIAILESPPHPPYFYTDGRVRWAVTFWQQSPGTNSLITNCNIHQLETAVWNIDTPSGSPDLSPSASWAAVAVMGTPGPPP